MQNYSSVTESPSTQNSAKSSHRKPPTWFQGRNLVAITVIAVVSLAIVVSMMLVARPQDIRQQAAGEETTVTIPAVDICTPWIEQSNLYPYLTQTQPSAFVRSLAEFTQLMGSPTASTSAVQIVWMEDPSGSQTRYTRSTPVMMPGDFRPDWMGVDASERNGFSLITTSNAQFVSSINSNLGAQQKLSPTAQIIDESVTELPPPGDVENANSAVFQRVWMRDGSGIASFTRTLTNSAQVVALTTTVPWTRESLATVAPQCSGAQTLAAASYIDWSYAAQNGRGTYMESLICDKFAYVRSVPITSSADGKEAVLDWKTMQFLPNVGWLSLDSKYFPADMGYPLALSEELYVNPYGQPDYGSLMRVLSYKTAAGQLKQAQQALPLTADFKINTQAGYENCQGIQ